MHFAFNNRFIKVTRTSPIFQKFQKIYILFSFRSWITNLYVKCIPDIKKGISFDDIEHVRFLPDKIKISLPRKTFLKP
jgi:hypothetical protein